MDAMKARVTAPAEVRQFCESVSESTTKNIRLLKAIEQTVDWLAWLQNRARADSGFATKAIGHLTTCERIKPVDMDGTLSTLFDEAEGGLQGLYRLLIAKRNNARNAAELERDHKEAVVEEYTAAISAIAELHNLMVDLHWAIGEHDADLSGRKDGLVHSSARDIEAYLETL